MAILPNPSGWVKNSYRVSRIVILPDYQNLGIGTKFLEKMGEYYLSMGKKLYIRTTHFRMLSYMNKHKSWLASSHNGKTSDKHGGSIKTNERMAKRVAGAFEYLGSDYVNKPHIHMCIDNTNDIDLEVLKSDLLELKKDHYVRVITGNINDPNPIEDMCHSIGVRTDLLYIKNKSGGLKLSPKHVLKKIAKTYNSVDKANIYNG